MLGSYCCNRISSRAGEIRHAPPPPGQIHLNFHLRCGSGPDPPQFLPWVWAWRPQHQIPLNFSIGCGSGPDPPQLPLGCGSGPDPPHLPSLLWAWTKSPSTSPWVWAWTRSPSISPLGVGLDTPTPDTPQLPPLDVGLDQIPSTSPLSVGLETPPPDPPQLPPWLWAWTRSPYLNETNWNFHIKQPHHIPQPWDPQTPLISQNIDFWLKNLLFLINW